MHDIGHVVRVIATAMIVLILLASCGKTQPS